MTDGREMVRGRGSSIYLLVLIVAVLAAVGYLAWSRMSASSSQADLRVSVPPYVDTAFTQVGVLNNAFGPLTQHITLVETTWENQYDVLAGGGLDISMSTVDEFVNKSRNLSLAGKPVVFILPAWKFRGLAFYTAKGVKPFSQFSGPSAKDDFLRQLKGKKVVLADGSVFDQALRSFVKGSGTKFEDLAIVNAPLDSALNSLSDPSVGIVAVGSQQRFEAERRGYKEAIAPEVLGLDVITGFVVPEQVYRNRLPDVLAFACGWYATAKLVTREPRTAYQATNAYLVGRGANSLTYDEYTALRAYNVVPTSPRDAAALFLSAGGAGYWKRVWDRSVAAMVEAGRGSQSPADTRGFVVPEVNVAALSKCG